MGYKTVAEIFNDVFNSSDHALNTVYKTDGEVLNLVFDESADGPALRVNLAGYIPAKDIIDGEVDTFAELPAATEHSGEIYIVSTTTGIPLINRKQAGMYRSDGISWNLLDTDLQADKVYYSGSVPAGNVQDALETLNALMNAHSSSTSNPHSVTAAQVDAYTISQINDLLASKLSTTGKAADSDKLDGFDSIYFAPASHNHDSAYLGIAGKAADADKLDGFDSSDFARFAQVTGAVGNINSPLLHLPLKKNLLTAQGQSVCTFTRASAATYVDRYGMLKSVAADIPRFTADGLLVEGASTNLLTYSEQFDNGAWSKTRATVSANTTAVTDPFGTNLADKIVEDTTASQTHQISQNYTGVSGTQYTFSVFAKAAELTQFRLFDVGVGGGASGGEFNLSAGTASTFGSGYTAAIRALADGWFRCSITYTCAVAGVNTAYLRQMKSGSATYTGDGTSGLYIFGAQLEAMPFATSYIQTTTTSATRAADTCYVPAVENIPAANTSDSSIICDVKLSGLNNSASSQTVWRLNDSFRYARNYTVDNTWRYVEGSSNISGGSSSTSKKRISTTFSTSSMKIYLDGISVSSTTPSKSVTGTATAMYIGSSGGTEQFLFGTISNLRIYDRALTAEEVRLA